MNLKQDLAKRAASMRRRGHIYREIADELGISESHAHVLVNGRRQSGSATARPARRMRLSSYGEIRALARLAEKHQPDAQGFWRKYGRNFTMVELANIEIIEPTVRIEDGSLINLDEDTSRQLYALAWERFEKALVTTNGLYNETPEGQLFHFNRVKRLLWEAEDLKSSIDTIYRMTAMPDDIEEIEESA